MKNEKNNHLKMAGFPSHQKKMVAFLTNNRHRRPSNPTSSKEVSTAWEVWEEYSELLGSLWLGDGVSLVVSVTDHTSCLNRRYIRVFPKNRGKKPKMDGLNNGKNLLRCGWFAGYHYFSETSIYNMSMFIHGVVFSIVMLVLFMGCNEKGWEKNWIPPRSLT